MRLSWNEIRTRAAKFAAEFADANYEKGETQTFYNAFFEIYGVKRRSVAIYESRVQKLAGNTGFIDLFWPQVLLVEQKSTGRDLSAARIQAEEYFLSLKENERPRYILACDFQNFELYDLSERTKSTFKLADLPDHVERFAFIMGVQKVAFKDQDPVNIKAAELVGDLHDKLKDAGFTGSDLEKFLVRIVFCLFADDTGVFQPRNLFLNWLEERTSEDGHDLGAKLAELFQTLDTPENQRGAHLDRDLTDFPYVNGDLFKGATRIPSFNAQMREALIRASLFDWSPISPAIFGSLFQSVMKPEERRKDGAHYTTEKNILKVIGPLFMDNLRAEFEAISSSKRDKPKKYRDLQKRLGSLRFFDPACGCGNFLVIAYREIRRLETDIIKNLIDMQRDKEGLFTAEFLATTLSMIDVDQFYGIEISEFPAEIARAAMWMMDHIMNNELSNAFGENYTRIPLERSPNIVHGDALEIEWASVLPPDKCSFVFGNPPFVGAKFQSDKQRAQVRRIAALGKSGGTLDYVAAWFIKAGGYVQDSGIPIALVATNSITQGEQVAQLWPILFDRCKLEITFAHRTFAWGSDARGKAHVHVVILGLVNRATAPKDRLLFSYDDINGEPHVSTHAAISPYLFDASALADPHVVVREASKPLNGLPKLLSGSQPIDDGNYIFDADQRADFLSIEPSAERFLRPYIGSREHINGGERWILALQSATPTELKAMPKVRERMRAVRAFREKSERKSTLAIASYPEKYNVEVIPTTPFLVVPEVSSERREYIPIAWLEPPVIPSNKIRILQHATKSVFGILTSAMHMSWVRHIGGRLKSDFQYGIGVIYNTFPLPPASEADLAKLEPLAQAVLDARADHQGATLAALYDPDTMPTNLRRAHQALDRAVDRLYRRKPFGSDRERVEFLLARYEELSAPLANQPKPRR